MRYAGVKGWLLLLCINLSILDPLSIMVNLALVSNMAKPFFNEYPGLKRLILINGTCSIALMVFSIYAGISLWKVLPNAVRAANNYLRIAFLYSLVSVFIPAMVGLPEKAYKDMAGNTFVNSLITMSYMAAWYLYLKRSKRVKATFGIQQP